MNQLDKAIKELVNEAEKIQELSFALSDKLRETKDSLNGCNFKFDFTYQINKDDYFMWKRSPSKKKIFRLYIKTLEIPDSKVFSETKLEVRAKYSPYLNDFYNQFVQNIKDYLATIK